MAFYRVTKKNNSPGPGPGPLPTQKEYCKFNTYKNAHRVCRKK